MDQSRHRLELNHPMEIDFLRIIFQGKWRLRVLREIAKGPARLSQLRRTVPECSKKVLIDTLRGLEELGWIERTVYPTKVRRVEYLLAAQYEEDVRRAIVIASRGEAHGWRDRAESLGEEDFT